MAIQWGPVGSNNFQLGIDQVGSTLIVYGRSVGWGHNWNATLTLGGAWSGSAGVSFYSPTSGTITKEFYRRTVSASGTYSASIGGYGAATVSRKVTFGSKPGAPTNFRFERTGDTTLTLRFTKGAGATTTQITASKNSATWYDLTNPTGSSASVSGVAVDSYWRFQAYSKNAAGNSAVVGPLVVYTKPKTPGKPSLHDGGVVRWASTAAYPHGFEIQRDDGGAVTTHTVEGRQTREWTDPVAQTIVTKYRVRAYAGATDNNSRAWSDWSAWSEAALDVIYKPPRITKFQVDRCNSAGQLDPLGTYLRVVSSGEVFSVKESPSGPELNTRTVRFRRRQLGSSSWTSWVSLVTNAAPAAWSNAGMTFGGGIVAVDQAHEVQMQVVDAFGQVQQQVTVPVAKTALSIGPAGIGVGKIWERGALDVGGDAHVEGSLHLADPNEIVIDGVAYQTSGTFTTSSLTMSASGNVFTANIQSYLDALPAAPTGWVRVPSIARGASNSTWVTNASGQWFVAGSTNATRAVTVAWQLFKDG